VTGVPLRTYQLYYHRGIPHTARSAAKATIGFIALAEEVNGPRREDVVLRGWSTAEATGKGRGLPVASSRLLGYRSEILTASSVPECGLQNTTARLSRSEGKGGGEVSSNIVLGMNRSYIERTPSNPLSSPCPLPTSSTIPSYSQADLESETVFQ
jgi:hypothetical protein